MSDTKKQIEYLNQFKMQFEKLLIKFSNVMVYEDRNSNLYACLNEGDTKLKVYLNHYTHQKD